MTPAGAAGCVRTFFTVLLLVLGGFTGYLVVDDAVHHLTVEGADIVVDKGGGGDFTTIQAAIDNATADDTIFIGAGTYFERPYVNKPLKLVGAGQVDTIIDGGGVLDVVYVLADDVEISHLTVRNSGPDYRDAGINVGAADRCHIHDCTLSGNTWGIYLYFSDDSLVESNTCVNNEMGLRADYAVSSRIKNNNMSQNSEYGMLIWSNCVNILVENNTCMSNYHEGILLMFCEYIVVRNNTCVDNYNGIEVRFVDTQSNVIDRNICRDNDGAGISLDHYTSNNTVENNTCEGNDGPGLWLSDAHNNTIKNNTFSNNYYGFASDGSNNTLFHNNFIGNFYQASGGTQDIWNNELDQGNYWSDYEGFDIGANGSVAGDGIGDTDVPHLGLDHYPYTSPFGWIYPGVPGLVGPSIDPDGEFMITWNATLRTTGYEMQMDDTEEFDDPETVYEGEENWYEATGLELGTYYFRARGVNKQFEGFWSEPLKVVVDPLPGMPQDITVEPVPEGNALNISWEPNVDDTVLYHIELMEGSDWLPLINITHPESRYVHSGLEDGERYYYRVQARDTLMQVSGWSATLMGVPGDTLAPAVPGALTLTGISSDVAYLRWDPSLDGDLEGYNVYRSETPNPSSWDDPVNEDVILGNEFIDVGLEQVTTYYYIVRAVDEVPNESTASLELEVTTFLDHLEIDEDTINSDSINLFSWFGLVSSKFLTFTCKGMEHIWVERSADTGAVSFIPYPDWNGRELVRIYATDGKFEVSGWVDIVVNPVNDPPCDAWVISPGNGTRICEGDLVTLEADGWDPDIPEGDELSFTWVLDQNLTLGEGRYLEDVEIPLGNHTIHLLVTDMEGATAAVSVAVDVGENTTIDTDGDGMSDVWERAWELDPLNPTDAATDTDDDGASNLQEFEEGTDPGTAEAWRPKEKKGGGDDDGLSAALILVILLVIVIIVELAASAWFSVRLKRALPEKKPPPQQGAADAALMEPVEGPMPLMDPDYLSTGAPQPMQPMEPMQPMDQGYAAPMEPVEVVYIPPEGQGYAQPAEMPYEGGADEYFTGDPSAGQEGVNPFMEADAAIAAQEQPAPEPAVADHGFTQPPPQAGGFYDGPAPPPPPPPPPPGPGVQYQNVY